jgi:triosephosphate isomerase
MAEKKQRAPLIAANWKMYKTIDEGKAFIETLAPLLSPPFPKVYIAVPFTTLKTLCETAASANKKHGTKIQIGAQNMHDASEGAFTGEIAAQMLVDAGASFVILGHSERRHLFNETSPFINRKVKAALQAKLTPIVCIGETLQERDGGKGEETVLTQLQESLEGIDADQAASLVLAYEPVWAIGTGRTATGKQAQQMHKMIRDFAAKHWDKATAERLTILYGGSVKPANTKELLDQPDIDGVLVGGASLNVESFNQIIHYQTEGVTS